MNIRFSYYLKFGIASFLLSIFWTQASEAQTFDRTLGSFSSAIQNTLNLRPGDITNLSLGVGPGLSPAFEGSKEYNWHAVPVVSLKYRDVLTVNNNDVDFTAFDKVIDLSEELGSSKLDLGPSVNFDFGRSENDSHALRGMGNVRFSVELGAYVRYTLERVSFEMEFGQDVASGHGGGRLDFSTAGTIYRNDRFAFGASATLTLATSKYLKSFFGVTATQAAASGLSEFHPHTGLKDVLLGLNANYAIAPPWSLLATIGYERLLGDAASSPLITQRGDANQGIGSIFVVYTF